MRAISRLSTLFAGLALVGGGLVVPIGSPAVADTAPAAGTPATVSADGLPTWQVNGVVWSQAVVGRTVYVTGSFTAARPPGVLAGGAGEVPALNVFAYDIVTGNRVASFNHALNGQGRVVKASPDGSRVYVGGEFSTVDGVATGRLVAFDTATNQVVSSFRPQVTGKVAALAVGADTVWLGGNFFNSNGQSRTRLAAVRTSNGTNLPWAPAANDEVLSMVLAPGGARVIVGGKFSTIGAQSVRGMGALDPVSGANLPWAANQKIRNGTPQSAITSLTTDGVSVFGSGFEFGGGNFEGTFAADPATGALRFVNDCHGDTYDTFPQGGVLYTVGHAHDCRWIGEFPEVNPRRWEPALAFTTTPSTRNNVGPDNYGWNYADQKTSTLLHWYPDLGIGSYTKQYQAAWSVAGNAGYVVMAGEFPTVNGIRQQGLTRMAAPGNATFRRGPVRSGTTAPAATSPADGRVTVQFPAAYDQDNQALTYQLFRSGTTPPVATVTAPSNFWTIPTVSVNDTGAVPGTTYTYTVRAVDADGNGVALGTTNSVRVSGTAPTNVAPTADFTSTTSGRTVAFASQASDADGTIVSQVWEFGDGTPAGAGANPSHAYAAPGSYAVRLTVTDDKGAAATVSRNVTIANATPVAAFTHTQNALTANFDASTSSDADGTVASYSWSWGDGTTNGSGSTPTHTYAAAGTYPVVLTVTDNSGATSSVTRQLTMSAAANQAPVARFTSTATQLAVAFDASTSSDADGTVATYSWTWGDGTPAGSGRNATHTYAGPGTYPVTLVVTDNRGGTGTVRRDITVTTGPAGVTTLASDAFGRTSASGWGAADAGGSWVLKGSAANFAVAGGAGSIRMATAGSGPSTFVNGVSSSRTDTSVAMSLRSAATGGGTYAYVLGRELPAGGGYRLALNFRADRSVTVGVLRRSSAGADTFLAPYAPVSGLSVNPGDQVNVRFVASGTGPTILRARVWAAGTPEPATWQLNTSDSTPALQDTGTVGLASYLSGSATGTPTYVDFRNFRTVQAD